MEEKKEISNIQGKFWTSSPLQAAQLVMGKEGPSALPPATVISLFNERVQKTPNLNALFVKRDGKWVSWTWKQYHEQVMLCARAILSFKPEPTDGVNIIGFNSPEWFMADLAGIAAGTIAAPIYSTNAPDAVHYIAEHSNGIVAFVENELQLAKFLKVRERLPKLQAIVQWSGKVPEEKGVYSWEAFLKLSEKVDPSELQKVIEAQTPTKCATLIYTSGTTGPPKAVMLSHDNITWTARVVQNHLNLVETDVLISYLPLSHIAAQMMDLITPLAGGYSMYFAQPDALKGSLATTIKEVQPTLFLGVPRVWEKFQEKMLEVGKSVTGVKKSLATWAKGKALENGYALQRHESGPWGFWLADTVVLSKVKQALGFTRLRLAATAAAPIAKETLDYFLSLNIPIYEIYGMSECTGPETFNLPTAFKIGSCGRIMPGTELKIDKPNKEGHGEICYRGRHIFMGYMKDPKASAETIDDEGYLHSGDIGILDKDGFLYITGRIKELIITAGGENIPPVLIEDEIKKELASVIANVMVVGDRKKFLTCIFTLKAVPIPDPKPGEYPFTEELLPSVIQALGDDSIKTVDAAIASEKVIKFLEAGVQKANSRATSNAQKVQKFIIVNRDFTIEGGELTPTLKLKRRIVLQQYQDQVEKLYQVDE